MSIKVFQEIILYIESAVLFLLYELLLTPVENAEIITNTREKTKKLQNIIAT